RRKEAPRMSQNRPSRSISQRATSRSERSLRLLARTPSSRQDQARLMTQFPVKLGEIARGLDRGADPEKVTVRTLLEWFGAQRRGFYVVENIRSALRKLKIKTEPDFESAYIDALLSFVRADASRTQLNPTTVNP